MLDSFNKDVDWIIELIGMVQPVIQFQTSGKYNKLRPHVQWRAKIRVDQLFLLGSENRT